MQDKINYTPSKCSMPECAFPYMQCSHCMSNVSIKGTRAFVLRNPDKNYQFCMGISRPKR